MVLCTAITSHSYIVQTHRDKSRCCCYEDRSPRAPYVLLSHDVGVCGTTAERAPTVQWGLSGIWACVAVSCTAVPALIICVCLHMYQVCVLLISQAALEAPDGRPPIRPPVSQEGEPGGERDAPSARGTGSYSAALSRSHKEWKSFQLTVMRFELEQLPG